MGCVQYTRPAPPIMALEHSTTTDDTQQHNVVINRQDSEEEDLENDFKYLPREIASTTTESQCTLNMVTLRVTNEISLLLHRNFPDQDSYNDTGDLITTKRLGSWWYSAIKTHQYSGIAMQNNTKTMIIYDDGLRPPTKIENKIELISGLFYTKIDFNSKDLQLTITADDFSQYLNGNVVDKGMSPFGAYSEDSSGHMIEYQNINRIPKQKCRTKKEFEYMDMIDVEERRSKMVEDLRIYESERDHTFIYVSDLCTDLEYRRKGIATALWLKLFALYDKGTRFGFHVRCDDQGKAARQFYFSLGFRHVGTVMDYYEKDINAWKMVLVL